MNICEVIESLFVDRMKYNGYINVTILKGYTRVISNVEYIR